MSVAVFCSQDKLLCLMVNKITISYSIKTLAIITLSVLAIHPITQDFNWGQLVHHYFRIPTNLKSKAKKCVDFQKYLCRYTYPHSDRKVKILLRITDSGLAIKQTPQTQQCFSSPVLLFFKPIKLFFI